MHPNRVTSHLALLAVALIYALNYFISKEVFHHLSAMAVLTLRSLSAVTVFGFLGLVLRRESIAREDWKRLLFCAFSGVLCNQLFFLWGLSLTTELNASVLMIISPVFVFLLAWISKTETLTLSKIAGVLLAFTGAAFLMMGGRQLNFTPETLTGDAMIVINALSYSAYLIAVRPLVHKYNNFTLMAWLFVIAAFVNIPLGIREVVAADWGSFSTPILGGVLYIMVCTTLLAYGLNAWAMRRVPASYVGIYVYIQPILAPILTHYLRPEHSLTLEKLMWMVVIFMGVGLVLFQKRKGNVKEGGVS